MTMMTLNCSPGVQLWLKSVVISTSLGSNNMTPNVLLQISLLFQKNESRKPSIIQPSLLMDTRLPLRKHFKSRFPAANVSRLNETVATETFFFDVPALDDGIMGHGGTIMLQLYCGCDSQLTAVFPMKTDREMAGTLEDFIRFHGAPNALFSDNAKAQIGRAVQEILRMYAIKYF
jgi:hypothetical protein